MAEEKPAASPASTVETKEPRNIFKRLGVAGFIGFILMVGVYLFATSGTFVKNFVLPKVSEALNAKVAVSDASVAVLGGKVELKDLLVQSDDTSLVTAKSARLKYSFWDLVGGRLRVSELVIDSPEVYVLQRADNSSNLDPIVEAMESTEKKEETTGEIDLLVENLALNNARFRFEKIGKNGVKEVTEAAEVKIEIDRFGSGIDGNLKMSTQLSQDKSKDGVLVDSLRATVSAGFKFAFDASLMPQTVTGDAALKVSDAQGNLQDVKGLNGDLKLDLDMANVKQLGLVFSRGAEALGRITVSGPYDIEAQSADLTIEIKDIGKSVLNLAAAGAGIRVGDTTVNSTIRAKVQNGGQTVDVESVVKVAALSVTQDGVVTPSMDIDVDCTAKLVQNGEAKSLSVSIFQVSAVQDGKQIVFAGIDRPLSIPLTKEIQTLPDGAVNIKVTDFDLGPWAPLTKGMVKSGVVNVEAQATVANAGAEISLTLDESVRNFSAQYESNSIAGLDAVTKLRLSLASFVNAKLDMLSVDASVGGQKVVYVEAKGTANLLTKNADIATSVTLDVARALQLYPVPDVKLDQGLVSFASRIRQAKIDDKVVQNVDGEVRVANLTGNLAGSQLDRFATAATLKANVTDSAEVVVESFTAPLSMAGQPAGTVSLNATANTNGNVRARVQATQLNANLFRPFVKPFLGNLQLASIDLNFVADAEVNGGNKSAKGSMQLANLVILDPQGGIPNQAIGLTTAFDVSAGADNSVKIPLLQGDVSIGNQPGGQFKVDGNLDGGSGKGNFKLTVNGINQNLIAPFAGAALGDKRLQSVNIDANATATLDLNGRSDFDAKLAVTNLVVIDPSGAIPSTPLGVGLDAKGAMNGKILDLENATLALAPTQRADNRLTLTGRVDLTDTNAPAANLKLTANALDLTTYYDLFMQPKSGQSAPTPAPAPPAATSNQEPPPLTLPIRNSRFETQIGKLYLREIEITNTVIVAAVDRQTVQVSPLQMFINGGKVDGSVDLNTGVPGYRYDLALKVDEVPIQPAVRSFSPAIGSTTSGALVANVRVAGAGQTGATLQRTLNGGVNFYLTNAVIQIPLPGQPAAAQPKPAPNSFLGAALGTVGSMGKSFAGSVGYQLIDKLGIGPLTKSPINHVSSVVTMGHGSIKVDRVDVRSEKIVVLVNGDIPIAAVLNDSPLNLPVNLWLDREGAKHLSFGEVGNEQLVKMPELVRVSGTLGAPSYPINTGNVIVLTAAGATKGVTKLLGGEGSKAADAVGGLLKGLGGFGKKPAPNQQPTTNALAKKKGLIPGFPF